MTIILLLLALGSFASAVEDPGFRYSLHANDEGYEMGIQMKFADDVSMNRVVSNMVDRALFHEFYENIDPVEIRKLTETSEGLAYESILSVKTFGYRTSMLSQCQERFNKHRTEWRRNCQMIPTELDGGTFMERKSEEMICASVVSWGGVECTFQVKGKFKDFLFVKASSLTRKAKVQALMNWGRFWFYTQSASVSAKYANEQFEKSQLKQDIQKLLEKDIQVGIQK